ncbi:competence/damage-inducible protein A [Synechococcus sp. PCC 6312]|uniref:competence/damage-inducible protein A n=1 Tax=Synechococcus sp. (strain ATCC 27167 / PCC 6312) TaxID=195253 RepID=UPI00029EDC07|nr:competence/damage-inducible protein A [Synechococcus sp. PCC 6312]AFY62300.1 competence/damage-inducible protein CinA-like protein [Synechococcus sp. PCC 6312]
MTALGWQQSAEIICIGTELLLGEVVNTNANYLAAELARLGIPHYYQTVVGDNPTRIKQAIAIACERARLLIFTGGLGPTPDDLTAETIADFFETPLIERPEIIADLDQKFAQRGGYSPSNRKQALLPMGAEILPNPTGTAPGLIWQPRLGLTLMTFPGVPSEMKAMWQQTAVPFLQAQGWGEEMIYSRVLRFWGIPESVLAEKVASQIGLDNPTVAPYAGEGEARLRITTKAKSQAEAEAIIAPVATEILQITGLDCYGADQDTLAKVVGQLLLAHHQTLGIAESCTGGGLGAMLTAIPGSSTYFLGGVISYANPIKVNVLGVDADALEQAGAVSAIVAGQMAQGSKQLLGSDWALSITGIAGPGGGSELKPVGLVFIGLAGPQNFLETFEYRFSPQRGRDWIRSLSSRAALDKLRRQLLREASPI